MDLWCLSLSLLLLWSLCTGPSVPVGFLPGWWRVSPQCEGFFALLLLPPLPIPFRTFFFLWLPAVWMRHPSVVFIDDFLGSRSTFLKLRVDAFHQFGKIIICERFKYRFCFTLFHSGFWVWDSVYTHSLFTVFSWCGFLIALLVFFLSFSLCTSIWRLFPFCCEVSLPRLVSNSWLPRVLGL